MQVAVFTPGVFRAGGGRPRPGRPAATGPGQRPVTLGEGRREGAKGKTSSDRAWPEARHCRRGKEGGCEREDQQRPGLQAPVSTERAWPEGPSLAPGMRKGRRGEPGTAAPAGKALRRRGRRRSRACNSGLQQRTATGACNRGLPQGRATGACNKGLQQGPATAAWPTPDAEADRLGPRGSCPAGPQRKLSGWAPEEAVRLGPRGS